MTKRAYFIYLALVWIVAFNLALAWIVAFNLGTLVTYCLRYQLFWPIGLVLGLLIVDLLYRLVIGMEKKGWLG